PDPSATTLSDTAPPGTALPVTGEPFVGRAVEVAELERAAAGAVASGRPRLALVSGAAGAGKTALARTLTARLEAEGWITAWGTSPELQGAPAAWPWTQMHQILTAAAHQPTPPNGATAPNATSGNSAALRGSGTSVGASGAAVVGDEPVAARFRRHRGIVAYLARIAAKGPVLLVFDDLHWADEETLALVTTLAAEADAGPVLVVGTYRSSEISAGLAEALGRAARTEPARVYLGGLTEPQVREMVRAITGWEPAADGVRVIHARTAGNPFFVRELTRLWENDGEAALHTVPAGVRDVIRHRLAGLTETARTHLRQAAVVGQEIDLDVLIRLAGDEDQVLDSVESALLAGFLVEQDATRLHFAHALVHETLYEDIARARRARWHAAAAEIIERTRPGDVEAIAHHLLRAENRAEPRRTAHYTRAAAERAEHRFAPHEAARLWRETVAALDRASDDNGHRQGYGIGDGQGDGRRQGGGHGDDHHQGDGKGDGHRQGYGNGDGQGDGRRQSDGHGDDHHQGGGQGDGNGRRQGGGQGDSSGDGHRSGDGDGHGRVRLEAVMGMVRALAVTGELRQARRHRAEATAAAEALGDPVLTARVIGSFDVPAIWTANDDETLSAGLVAAAERVLP
ncbi:ATP-binding protein, partial [Nonomuraea cypriaca]|uniref:ATP-binding protein n=1 Tax=Nonomuraea cypriaca TaxID=1187855 RepID=UPI001A9C5B57